MSTTKSFAVVTGASSGIGRELAAQFAEHDYDLLICAEDAGIREAAEQLQATGAQVSPVQVDLRSYDGVEELYSAIVAMGRPVDALALNAGVGLGGAFLDNELAEELHIVELNVNSTVHLAKLVLRDMAARNSGKVLITSSIASTMPGAYQAVYNASKSFLQSFAEALQEELKHTDITITSLMPGPTETNFFVRARMAFNTNVGQSKKDDPSTVAKQGYAALQAGRNRVVAGSLKTKVQELTGKALPDRAKAIAHRVMAKPKDGQEDAA